MCLDRIDKVIAERVLVAVEGDQSLSVRVIIGSPEPYGDGTAFFCPFQILGVGSERIKYAAGVDSVQSLQLVMLMIDTDLSFTGLAIHWPLSESGGTGFGR